MNSNDFKNDVSSSDTYRATNNLNTAIENPQINMNSAVGINIKNVDSNHFADSNSVYQNMNNNYFEHNGEEGSKGDSLVNHNDMSNTNQFIPSSNNENFSNSEFVPNYPDQTTYQPTMEEKKRKEKFSIPKELKVMFFIAFILVIFLLLMPYIYDFFRKLQMVISG